MRKWNSRIGLLEAPELGVSGSIPRRTICKEAHKVRREHVWHRQLWPCILDMCGHHTLEFDTSCMCNTRTRAPLIFFQVEIVHVHYPKFRSWLLLTLVLSLSPWFCAIGVHATWHRAFLPNAGAVGTDVTKSQFNCFFSWLGGRSMNMWCQVKPPILIWWKIDILLKLSNPCLKSRKLLE